MAMEANGIYDSQRAISKAPRILARVIMVTSWVAGLVLAWTTVVSVDIRWRSITMIMSALIVAPNLVLAFRQLTRELPLYDITEQTEPDLELTAPDESADDGKLGVYVDQLTGLASRRYLTMFLQREIHRSERVHASLSVAIFDVDEFQRILDHAGADAAARGLADVGSRLKSILREYDLVAKYSAGRLALVLPESDARAAAGVVERLHELATSVCVAGEPLAVTVGLATFPDHGATVDELINSAHRALNRGKSGSANAVHTLEEMRKAS